MDAPPSEAETDGEGPAVRKRGTRALAALCLGLFVLVLIQNFAAEVYVVVGDSMSPTLEEEERLLVHILARDLDLIERGDILVVIHPDDDDRRLIKRVIGLGGDEVEIRAGRLFINGVERDESAYLTANSRDPTINIAPYEVPEGRLFILGDNRNNSHDSKDFGAVSSRRVVGEVLMVLWPLQGLRCP